MDVTATVPDRSGPATEGNGPPAPTPAAATPAEPPAWRWTDCKARAAALVAAGELTLEAVAAEVGVSVRQLFHWRTRVPQFQERVEELMAEYRAALREQVRRLGRERGSR